MHKVGTVELHTFQWWKTVWPTSEDASTAYLLLQEFLDHSKDGERWALDDTPSRIIRELLESLRDFFPKHIWKREEFAGREGKLFLLDLVRAVRDYHRGVIQREACTRMTR